MAWAVDVGGAAHRVGRIAASRAPPRHHVEVRRKAPAVDALEHVVLQHEMPRVGPIVRDLGRGVIPERVGHGARRGGGGAHRVHGRVVTRPHPAGPGRPREPVHGPAVDVTLGRDLVVRTAPVDQRRVVVRAHASADAGNGHAHGRHAAYASGSRPRRGRCRSSCRTTGSPASRRSRGGSCGCHRCCRRTVPTNPAAHRRGRRGRSCRCSSTRPRSPRAPTRARSPCAVRSSCRRCGAHRGPVRQRHDNATFGGMPWDDARRGQARLTRSVYRPREYQLFTWK